MRIPFITRNGREAVTELAIVPGLRESAPAAARHVRARYEASLDSDDRDWSNVGSNPFEDQYFTGSLRTKTIARFRSEVHNNPYLTGLVEKFPEAIGVPHFRARTSDPAYNEQLDQLFYMFSKRLSVQGDSLLAAVRITLRELLLAGEIFWVLLKDGRVQLIESEYCGSGYNRNNLREINGVIYNSNWVPTGYRFAVLNERGQLDWTNGTVVEARNVIHVYARERVNQGRGLPLLLPSLNTARDLHEICRAKTKQIKSANQVTGTIEREGITTQFQAMGGTSDGALAAATPSAEPVKIELRNGTFVGLEPGEKLNMLTTEYHASDYQQLIMLMLHAVAAPVGLPVELWFSGLGDVNYSGFKGLGTVWEGRRRYFIGILEDRLLNRLAMWKTQGARKAQLLPGNPDADDDLFEWAWRHTPVLDEEKEASAAQKRLDSGVGWLGDEWERKGYYVEEVLERRKQDWRRLQLAAGLDPEAPPPIEFLWKGQLPGVMADVRRQTPMEE